MENEGAFELVLKAATSLPIVKIDRRKFLEKELIKYFSREQVEFAIENNPAYAGMDKDKINKIANSCINFETNKVSAISFATGIPGGFGMMATIPADITQYFAHILRIMQKLIYLYGWEELFDDYGNIDDETTNLLTFFVGIMFGVKSASSTIAKISASSAQKASKSLASKALTKGTLFPIVKKISQALGVKMTKEIFARGVSKIIPIVGGVASGGITYISYKSMSNKLKNYLLELKWADPNYYESIKMNGVRSDI